MTSVTNNSGAVSAEAGVARRLLTASSGIPFRTWAAIAGLSVMAGMAILAPVLSDHSPTVVDLANRLIPPAWLEGGDPQFLLGTDGFGRDIVTRLMYGARISLSVAFLALFFGGVLGAAIGIVSGYWGGRTDALLMRTVDIFLAFPTILFAIALAVAFGPSFWNITFVIAFLLWPNIARQVRGDTLVIMRENYMEYALGIGVSPLRNMFRHVLPNVAPTLLVVTTLELGKVILLEATLGFLGAGIPPPNASWGVMVSEGSGLVATGWWLALFPGLAITITVLSFNTLGDWMRDHFDPRLRDR